MGIVLSYILAGVFGAVLHDAAKWVWRVQPISRWLRHRRLEREYRAAKRRIAKGGTDPRDQDIVYYHGHQWTPQELADLENRRRSKAVHAVVFTKIGHRS
jgi:hypothetical protein